MEEQGNSPTGIDLRLGLSTSSLHGSSSNAREQLPEKENHGQPSTFFIKVYMEGDPVGRKVDLFSIDGYESLIKTLRRMFCMDIIYLDVQQLPSSTKAYVLVYEDKDRDWMMGGDLPWEMFLKTVQRLKITTPDKC